MNNNLIKELPLSQKLNKLEKSNSETDALSNEVNVDFLYEFLISIDLPKPIVLLHSKGGESLYSRVSKFPPLKELLSHLPELNFDSILFALTFYSAISNQNPIELINNSKRFKSIPALEDILKPTYGYILFAHQFEQIYSRIPSTLEYDIVTLRKDWNKKKPEAIDVVKETKISDGVSFYDLVLERTVEENHFVWNANFNGANLLWGYLNKVKSKK
jgi:hypothetical protein